MHSSSHQGLCPHQDNASKLLLALMESRHDSENAERILISLRPQELVRAERGGRVKDPCELAAGPLHFQVLVEFQPKPTLAAALPAVTHRSAPASLLRRKTG